MQYRMSDYMQHVDPIAMQRVSPYGKYMEPVLRIARFRGFEYQAHAEEP